MLYMSGTACCQTDDRGRSPAVTELKKQAERVENSGRLACPVAFSHVMKCLLSVFAV